MRAMPWVLERLAATVMTAGLCACNASAVLPGGGGSPAGHGSGGAAGAPAATGGGASIAVGVGGGGGSSACVAAEAAQSSYGCEFWAVEPDNPPKYYDRCFAVVVANIWSEPVRIDVYRSGTHYSDTSFIRIPQGQGLAISYALYDPVAGLAPGEVAIAFLSHSTIDGWKDCPVSPALDGDDALSGTGWGQAWSIKTDGPVAAYSIWPYGGGDGYDSPSGSLLLPASAWDTSYLAINPYEKTQTTTAFGNNPSLAILAREHGTEVTILPKVAIEGGFGVPSSPANTPITYFLGAGGYLQLTQAEELTGSVIQSNEPIGVWGTANLYTVPNWALGWETEHGQVPPLRAWGSRYAGVRYRNRLAAMSEEAPPWRLVGAVDGTVLGWTPSAPDGAPATLGQGEVVEFFASGPFVVESQDEDHPFYLAQYMTGAEYVNPWLSEGDPEWVNVVPTEQYLDRYLFFTDPTFGETHLVVVRKKAARTQQFADVVLDCAGPVAGWEPVGELEYSRVDLVTGFQPVNGCDNGRHEMTSAAPFSVTVWGWGLNTLAASYAFTAGGGLQPINDVAIPPTPR